MKIKFYINYHTIWGENLYILGNIPQLGNSNIEKASPLKFIGNDTWTLEIDNDIPNFEYQYCVKKEDTILLEKGNPHVVNQIEIKEEIVLYDQWRGSTQLNIFKTSAFHDVIYKRNSNIRKQREIHPRKSVIFSVFAPRVQHEHAIGVMGNCYELGNWDENNFVELSSENYPSWEIKLDVSRCESTSLEYKYVLFDKKSRKIIQYEQGNNRYIQLTSSKINTSTIYCNDDDFRANMQPWKAAGVAIPIFSIRTEDGYGIGEFCDIKKMVDWCIKTRLRILQILPINDTTNNFDWHDSYPYNAISMYALHPIYINIERIGGLTEKQIESYKKERKALNALPSIDYDTVIKNKWKYLQILYKKNYKKDFESESYKIFFEENKSWLIPYATYCLLREKYKSSNFHDWQDYAIFNKNNTAKLIEDDNNKSIIGFYYFVQYHLFLQLSDACKYARSKGIILKGDIPIGVNPNSVEAWTEPELFNTNAQAGAPPDNFSLIGQNWGFPTYNWSKMKEQKYQWWLKRFRALSQYFDAYRIDHLLGFFRIFEIPTNSIHGLLGYFNPTRPMTVGEIADFNEKIIFDHERFLKPYITDATLEKYLGKYSQKELLKYLYKGAENTYHLKPELNTQRKIQSYFWQHKIKDKELEEGLMFLLDEVIFIEDPYQKEHYHPRINIHGSLSFQSLSEELKSALNSLYEYYFYQRHEVFWAKEAKEKLNIITNATSMLACGEDLGMIPNCVPKVMKDLQILSLEIQRMPKTMWVKYEPYENFPYLSVLTTSTHDMSTMRQWWQESNREDIQFYYNNLLGESGNAPEDCEPWICEKIINRHLLSTPIFSIFPIQDWLGINAHVRPKDISNDRINDPADSNNYWNFRVHKNIEELIKDTDFCSQIAQMINQSNRDSRF